MYSIIRLWILIYVNFCCVLKTVIPSFDNSCHGFVIQRFRQVEAFARHMVVMLNKMIIWVQLLHCPSKLRNSFTAELLPCWGKRKKLTMRLFSIRDVAENFRGLEPQAVQKIVFSESQGWPRRCGETVNLKLTAVQLPSSFKTCSN